jgi:hypothetical protein
VVVALRELLLLLPYGCTAATIFLPLVLGYLRPLDLIKWNFVPDFKNGLSVLPDAETIPIVARQKSPTYFDFPDGSLIIVPLGVCVTTVA